MIACCDLPRAATKGGAGAYWPGKLRVSHFSTGLFVCFDGHWSASRHVTVLGGRGGAGGHPGR